jgi:serine/threonine protein kinase
VARTATERRVLQRIRHPFLVTLHFAFQSRTKLYLVIDFMPGGDLHHWLMFRNPSHTFPEARVRMYAAEMALALQCLHAHGIIHRDLKVRRHPLLQQHCASPAAT